MPPDLEKTGTERTAIVEGWSRPDGGQTWAVSATTEATGEPLRGPVAMQRQGG